MIVVMRKDVKIKAVQRISIDFDNYAHFYLVDAMGLNATKANKLRMECHKRGIKFVVCKNTLIKRALEQVKIKQSSIVDFGLKGSTSIMFSNHVNSPAKLIDEFARESVDNVPKIKLAYVYEELYMGSRALSLLLLLKTKNELISDIIALLQTSIMNIISTVQACEQTIHLILKVISNSKKRKEI